MLHIVLGPRHSGKTLKASEIFKSVIDASTENKLFIDLVFVHHWIPGEWGGVGVTEGISEQRITSAIIDNNSCIVVDDILPTYNYDFIKFVKLCETLVQENGNLTMIITHTTGPKHIPTIIDAVSASTIIHKMEYEDNHPETNVEKLLHTMLHLSPQVV